MKKSMEEYKSACEPSVTDNVDLLAQAYAWSPSF